MNNDLFPTEDLSHDDKSRWLDRFNARDEKVFNGWHAAKYKALFFYAKNFLYQYPEEIKDVLQESFIKVWKSPSQFETMAQLNSYFYTTTRNECLQFLRARGIEHRAMKEYGELTERIESDTDVEKIHTERIEEIDQKMRQLPSIGRQAILLSILEDKTHAEIAALLEISQTNAGVTKFRSLSLLREWLGLSKRDKKGPALSILLLLTSFFR
jgi:RNA polymerase sigma-70 factor (ECF subfamily)